MDEICEWLANSIGIGDFSPTWAPVEICKGCQRTLEEVDWSQAEYRAEFHGKTYTWKA